MLAVDRIYSNVLEKTLRNPVKAIEHDLDSTSAELDRWYLEAVAFICDRRMINFLSVDSKS